MKKYLVIREQSGGCDYTIRCGLDYKIYAVPDGMSLEEIIKDELLRNYESSETAYRSLEERRIKYTVAYEIVSNVSVNHNHILDELRLENDRLARANEIVADEAEFERLKKKLKK